MPDDESDYRRGPGWQKSPRGAVIEAYVETEALDRACPPPPRGCNAPLGEFCTFPDGTQRHIPHVARTKPASGRI